MRLNWAQWCGDDDGVHIPHEKEEDPVLNSALRAMFAMVVLVLIAVTRSNFWHAKVCNPANEIIAQAQISISIKQVLFKSLMRMVKCTDWDGDEGGFVSGVARVIERERMKIGAPIDAPVIVNGAKTIACLFLTLKPNGKRI